MSRGVYLLGVGIVAVSLAFVATAEVVWRLGPRVSEAQLRRIRPGKTAGVVGKLLGPTEFKFSNQLRGHWYQWWPAPGRDGDGPVRRGRPGAQDVVICGSRVGAGPSPWAAAPRLAQVVRGGCARDNRWRARKWLGGQAIHRIRRILRRKNAAALIDRAAAPTPAAITVRLFLRSQFSNATGSSGMGKNRV